MRIAIKLMGSLKPRTPEGGSLDLAEGATINDALAQLGLAAASVQIVMHNGKPQADRSRVLTDGDELTILPPVGGG